MADAPVTPPPVDGTEGGAAPAAPVGAATAAAETPPAVGVHGPPAARTVWSLGAAAGIVALMVALTVAAGVGIGIVRLLGLNATATALLGGAGLTFVYLAVLGAVWLIARRRHLGFRESVELVPVPAGVLIANAAIVAVGARFVGTVWAVMLTAFDVRVPGSDLDPTRVFGSGPAGVAMMVLVGVVLAPVVEEVVFRGVLLPALRVRWGVTAAVVVSSVAFALVHVSLFAIPPIFVLALMLARSMLRTRSLWVPIAGHAAFNAIGIGALYLSRGFGAL